MNSNHKFIIDFTAVNEPFVLAYRRDHPLAKSGSRMAGIGRLQNDWRRSSSGNRLLIKFSRQAWKLDGFAVRHLSTSLPVQVEAGLGISALPGLATSPYSSLVSHLMEPLCIGR